MLSASWIAPRRCRWRSELSVRLIEVASTAKQPPGANVTSSRSQRTRFPNVALCQRTCSQMPGVSPAVVGPASVGVGPCKSTREEL